MDSEKNTDLELLWPSEVAQLMRTSTRALAVARCQRRDTPPYLRVGRRILYRRREVLAWLDAHHVDPGAPRPARSAEEVER